jgi:hypothetical protein
MDQIHPAASGHLPAFITPPGHSDWLFNVTIVLVIAIVLVVGNLYFRLHALPEQLAHRGKKVQMEIVAVLALIALFTHDHIWWIAALLLAFIELPDFTTPISSMARSLDKLARDASVRPRLPEEAPADALPAPPAPAPVPAPPLPTTATDAPPPPPPPPTPAAKA